MVGVTHAGLALAADALTRGTLDHIGGSPIPLGLDMGTIEEIFDVGPTHDLLGHPKGGDPRGAFEFYPVTSETDAIGVDRALWGGSRQEAAFAMCVANPQGPGTAGSGLDGAAKEDESDCQVRCSMPGISDGPARRCWLLGPRSLR